MGGGGHDSDFFGGGPGGIWLGGGLGGGLAGGLEVGDWTVFVIVRNTHALIAGPRKNMRGQLAARCFYPLHRALECPRPDLDITLQ